MTLGYLVNQYPKISHTFVRREIKALEAHGAHIHRYSIRRTIDPLPDPDDQAEMVATRALLSGGIWGLGVALVKTALSHPVAVMRAVRLAVRVGRRSDQGLLRTFAVVAEACLLLSWTKQDNIEHLHAHFGTNSAAVAMFCHLLGGPPYSFTVHGPEEFDKAPLLYLEEKIAHARFVFAISHFGRSQLLRRAVRADWPKIRIVRCGVDDLFLAATPTPLPPTPRLLSIGRLEEQKGQPIVIEALGILHARGIDFHLDIIGEGPLRPALEADITRLGLGDKVKLLGWASGQTVRDCLSASSVLVMPSFAEGLPVVIMEALALGRPVISTYVAGIPELVVPGECGWLVPPGSVDALADAITAALATPTEQLTAMGLRGRERVRDQHDITRIGADIKTTFESP